MEVRIKKLHPDAVIPTYAKDGDAGMDLTAVTKSYDRDGNVVYGTGLAFEIPEGYVGLVFPRSSLSRLDIALSNCVGVIDSGYRGEVTVKFKPAMLFNREQRPIILNNRSYEVGERIIVHGDVFAVFLGVHIVCNGRRIKTQTKVRV